MPMLAGRLVYFSPGRTYYKLDFNAMNSSNCLTYDSHLFSYHLLFFCRIQNNTFEFIFIFFRFIPKYLNLEAQSFDFQPPLPKEFTNKNLDFSYELKFLFKETHIFQGFLVLWK